MRKRKNKSIHTKGKTKVQKKSKPNEKHAK